MKSSLLILFESSCLVTVEKYFNRLKKQKIIPTIQIRKLSVVKSSDSSLIHHCAQRFLKLKHQLHVIMDTHTYTHIHTNTIKYIIFGNQTKRPINLVNYPETAGNIKKSPKDQSMSGSTSSKFGSRSRLLHSPESESLVFGWQSELCC